MNRNEMIEKLKEGQHTVTFTKINGDERIMDCTLKTEFIPEDMRPTDKATTYSEDVIRVYDVKANGWRSFRFDSVTSFV
jgi:hypothetical protein